MRQGRQLHPQASAVPGTHPCEQLSVSLSARRPNPIEGARSCAQYRDLEAFAAASGSPGLVEAREPRSCRNLRHTSLGTCMRQTDNKRLQRDGHIFPRELQSMRNSEAWSPSPQLQDPQISTDGVNLKLVHLWMHIIQRKTDHNPQQRDDHILSSRARSLT
jgi:hypothetical protein